ncbi:hypothetical protein GT021_25180 [Streptomyces sp. SID5470]|nr:hypothetical protein [Streptomyces sp. SID5470]
MGAALATADLNRDGYADLAVADGFEHIYIYRGGRQDDPGRLVPARRLRRPDHEVPALPVHFGRGHRRHEERRFRLRPLRG